MYPNLYYLLNGLFGLQGPFWEWFGIIQTFGFMMAMAFMAAYFAFKAELKRKEADGVLKSFQIKMWSFKKPEALEYFWNGLTGFLLGFKLLYFFTNKDEVITDPQGFLLSAQGSWPGGAVLMAIFIYLRYAEYAKFKGQTPQLQPVTVHPHQLMGSMLMYAAIAGLLGAKIFHNLENLDDFARDPWGSLFSFSGLTFYGGLICGAGAVLWYANRHGIHWRHMLDVGGPGMMLAYAVGRIGCQLSGDGDWGIDNFNPKPAWFPFPESWWASKYPHNVINDGVPIEGCIGRYCSELPHPVYPTPIYEILICLMLFAGLWAIRKKITTPGILFSIYLIVNGLERFFIEKIRINTRMTVFGITSTQAELIAMSLILLGVAGLYYFSQKSKTVTNPVPRPLMGDKG